MQRKNKAALVLSVAAVTSLLYLGLHWFKPDSNVRTPTGRVAGQSGRVLQQNPAQTDAALANISPVDDLTGIPTTTLNDGTITDLLRAIEYRLDTIQDELDEVATIAHDTALALEDLSAAGSLPLSGRRFDGDEQKPSSPQATMDLESLLDGEAEFSEWGNRVASNLVDAYQHHFSDRPFFLEHGATIASDCRQSVCRMELRMSELNASMADDERALIVAQAERELLALAGYAGDVGRVSTVFDMDSEPPSVALLMQQREVPGGDAMISQSPKRLGLKLEELY
jgi:hypothetical protein